MFVANEITQRLTIFRPTGLFGLGFISGFLGGFALLLFSF